MASKFIPGKPEAGNPAKLHMTTQEILVAVVVMPIYTPRPKNKAAMAIHKKLWSVLPVTLDRKTEAGRYAETPQQLVKRGEAIRREQGMNKTWLKLKYKKNHVQHYKYK